jgi:hypothetical protein
VNWLNLAKHTKADACIAAAGLIILCTAARYRALHQCRCSLVNQDEHIASCRSACVKVSNTGEAVANLDRQSVTTSYVFAFLHQEQ